MVAQRPPRNQIETKAKTDRQRLSPMRSPIRNPANAAMITAHTMVSKIQTMASVRFSRAVCAEGIATVYPGKRKAPVYGRCFSI